MFYIAILQMGITTLMIAMMATVIRVMINNGDNN